MKRFILLIVLLIAWPVNAGWYYGGGTGSGTLGHEVAEATSGSFEGKCNQWTANATFTVTKGYFYNGEAATSSFKMSVWSDDGSDAPLAELGCSDTTAGDAVENWDEVTFTGAERVSIVNTTKYWVCFVFQTDSVANNYFYTTNTPPETYNNDGNSQAGCETAYAAEATDRKISMYVSSD